MTEAAVPAQVAGDATAQFLKAVAAAVIAAYPDSATKRGIICLGAGLAIGLGFWLYVEHRRVA